MTMELSREDAFTFLENILKISNPQSKWMQNNKLDFLQSIITNWYRNVPFQNIYQIQLAYKENRAPTIAEIIKHQMQGHGGVCLYNAVFCYLLLKALDYDVHLVAATIILPKDHAIVVAKNVVSPGDSYLVEVGCGWPAFHPVQLDNLPTDLSSCKDNSESILEYTYIREGSFVVRYHRRGDFVTNPNPEYKDGWRKHSYIELKAVSIEFLYSENASVVKTIKDVEGIEAQLMKLPLVVLYPENSVVFIKERCLTVMINGERVKREITNKEEMIQLFKKYFPVLDLDVVSEVIDLTQNK